MRPIIVAVMMLLTGVGRVIAADMPVPQAAPVPPPVYYPAYYNWSGIYGGINTGYGFGQSKWTNVNGSTGNFNTSAFLIGGTLGANYQFSPYLVGFEGDFDWSTLSGSTSCSNLAAPPSAATCQTKNDWLGTARARIGYTFDRVLVFGTAGAAFGNMRAIVNTPTTSAAFNIPPQLGWTVGAGVEYAFTEAISAKVEYLFVNLGTAACPVALGCVPTTATPTSHSLSENLVRAGANYRFNW